MFCGAILPEHWARFQVYASRIHVAAIYGSGIAEIHFSVWPFLAVSCRGAPLMPRLRELKAYCFSTSQIAALALSLTPTLRIFQIWFALDDFKDETRSRSPHVSASLLQTLPLLVPDLEYFMYGAGFNLPEPCLQSLMRFKNLKSLYTPSNVALREPMLQTLSSITTLQNLSCRIDLSDISAPTFPPHAFQGLTNLTLHGHSDHLLAFILACEFTNLVCTKFCITQPPSVGQPRQMWTALCQRANPALLTSIAAHFAHAFATRPRFLMEYVEPLLEFPGIAFFELAFPYTEPSIRDDDLARFCAAWPRLATFYIEHGRQYSQPDVGRPTLTGIVEFARQCPSLTTLYIPELEPSPLPDKSTVPAFGHRLRSMWINNVKPPLTLQVYTDVAMVVDYVFPWINLTHLPTLYYGPSGQGWLEVLQLVHVMRIGRENKRASTNL